jgi:hypothetical protein
MPSTAKQPPDRLGTTVGRRHPQAGSVRHPLWLGHTGIESGVSIFGIALVQVPLCSFNAVSTVFVWAITSAGISVWMKCPPSVL